MSAPGDARGWRRNPVAWLVLAIPLATVVAGFWTLWLAAGDGATDAHPDPVRRMAQVQEASLEADQAAARAGLSGRLQLEAGGDLLQLQGATGAQPPVLRLVHPISAGRDRDLVLRPDPLGWRSPASLAGGNRWQVQVVAADGRWRLVGHYRPGDTEVALRPAVAAR